MRVESDIAKYNCVLNGNKGSKERAIAALIFKSINNNVVNDIRDLKVRVGDNIRTFATNYNCDIVLSHYKESITDSDFQLITNNIVSVYLADYNVEDNKEISNEIETVKEEEKNADVDYNLYKLLKEYNLDSLTSTEKLVYAAALEYQKITGETVRLYLDNMLICTPNNEIKEIYMDNNSRLVVDDDRIVGNTINESDDAFETTNIYNFEDYEQKEESSRSNERTNSKVYTLLPQGRNNIHLYNDYSDNELVAA